MGHEGGVTAQLARALSYGGEAGAMIGALEWATTPLGPLGNWPRSLQSAVSLCLGTSFPMVVNWGPELIQIYNDAAAPVFGRKHPAAMGRSARQNFPEFWELTPVEHLVQHIWETAIPFNGDDQRLAIDRRGVLEDAFFRFSLSPLVGDDGAVLGLLNTYLETTARVLGARRLATLRALAERAAQVGTVEDACREALTALATNPWDVRFVLLYLVQPDGSSATLAAAHAIERGHPVASPERVALSDEATGDVAWPLARVLRTGEATLVEDLASRFDVRKLVSRRIQPREAMVLPIARLGEDHPAGALVVGLGARVVFDDAYRSFLRMVAGHVAAALGSARAYQAARERVEKLAELDRAKSTFFNNVSHELRTPLTLLLGPVEDLLRGVNGPITDAQRAQLDTIHRNVLRLSRLVTGLLDFARIEAGRLEPTPEPTDLAAFTRELVGAFESAVSQAGLRLTLDAPPLPCAVAVDRQMWEKIVLNLLSNAVKYTQRGEIDVRLRMADSGVRLTVRDTGVGIAAEDLPHVFERFYRVRGAASARSAEGAGIGLALVHELAKLHGGTMTATSAPGRGSTFTVDIPATRCEPYRGEVDRASAATVVTPWIEEVQTWLSDRVEPALDGCSCGEPPVGPRERVLVVDDNADVRSYLARLLRPRYDVETAPDGEAALAAARAHPPDLVLSDVVMPRLDGFALLRALRADAALQGVPVVLLSARAGEEAALEGLGCGADDYLIKPFSARELLARVRTHLELSRARREAAQSQLKDAFLGIASHELRTPLTSLSLQIQIALRALEGTGSPAVPRLAAIRKSITRMESLIEELLSVSTIQAGKLRLERGRHDLIPICREAAEEQILLSGRAVTLELPNEPLEAMVDAPRLAQVVTNLLSNALKYSPQHSPVVLSLSRAGDEAVLAVRDRGPGLSPEQIAHVFERFYRVTGIEVQSGSRTGLGLGLYICKTIVDQHGGRIWVESAVGRGCTFSVALPLAKSDAPRPAKRRARPRPARARLH